MNFEPFTFVLERVSQVLVDEVKLLSTDTKKLFQRLQQQLELAQSFVRDVEEEKEKATISNVLESESRHIMQILPQIEDFLDTLHLEEVQKFHQPSSIQKVMACFSCTSNPLIHRHVVIDTALQLISDLEDVRKRAGSFQRTSNTPVTQRRRFKTQPNVMNEEFIVGLDEDVKTLVAKLKGIDGERKTVLVVAGMGGSGKTTLARKLYNHEEIKRQFTSCHAWVCVSQEWDVSKLLCEMCAQLHIPVTEGESTYRVKLLEFLQTSSCLVVLDDVWEKEVLQELLPLLLPGGGREGNGGVLITTRKEEIIHDPFQDGVYIHKARALTQEQSWELFSKIICKKWQGKRAFDVKSTFAELGKEMLKRCDGLALAIVALAGLLSTKDTMQEWSAMKDRASSTILRQNKGFLDYGPVKSMLELSYSDLPYDLKPCFLYLGIYPEDSEIAVDHLIQLWIGEGFIRSDLCNEGQTLEELGMDFVHEIVQRCMVQVVKKSYGEKVAEIQVHDLMRDLCIEKARESGFFEVASQSTIPSNSKEYLLSRRIIFHEAGWYPDIEHTSHFRSVIRLPNCGYSTLKLEIAYGEMKLLRVLDIVGVRLTDSAQEIGNLTLLRYLRFEWCLGLTEAVLESIKKLINLLNLVLGLHDGTTIPNNLVGSMKQLRYLSVTGRYEKFTESTEVEGLSNLRHLQTKAGEWLSKELPAASFIHTLRKLILHEINSQEQLDAIYGFLNNPSNHLHDLKLDIVWSSGLGFDLQRMKLEYCPLLECLRLWGGTREQNGPFFFPPNLLSLYVGCGNFEKDDNLEIALTHLHHLRNLELYDCSFQGGILSMTGLSQLQTLLLTLLQNLGEWRMEEGSLPQLKELNIYQCEKLERIPEEISHIHNLQQFHAEQMSSSFCKRLEHPSEEEDSSEAGGGQDFHLIRHIPDIYISSVDDSSSDDQEF